MHDISSLHPLCLIQVGSKLSPSAAEPIFFILKVNSTHSWNSKQKMNIVLKKKRKKKSLLEFDLVLVTRTKSNIPQAERSLVILFQGTGLGA